jgi:hypothetical protein
MRRLLSAARHRRHREALGNRPTLLRGSAGSLAARGTGRTGRKPRDGGPQSIGPGTEERSRGLKEERRQMSTLGSRKRARRVERRKAQRPQSHGDAPCLSQEGAAVEAPFRRSTPSLYLVRERRTKGVPGAFSNNTGGGALAV